MRILKGIAIVILFLVTTISTLGIYEVSSYNRKRVKQTSTFKGKTFLIKGYMGRNTAKLFHKFARINKGKKVLILLDTLGGSVYTLYRLFSIIEVYNLKYTTICHRCASAGLMIQAYAENRYFMPEHFTLFHYPTSTYYRLRINGVILRDLNARQEESEEIFKKMLLTMTKNISEAYIDIVMLLSTNYVNYTSDWVIKSDELEKIGLGTIITPSKARALIDQYTIKD